jgi:serine/threonine protein kinase
LSEEDTKIFAGDDPFGITRIISIPKPAPGIPVQRITELFGDKFKVERVLGSGTFGIVLLALHEAFQQHVAVKLVKTSLTPDKASQIAGTKARYLSHPNIVKILGFEFKGDWVAVIMEYVDGKTIGELRKSKHERVFSESETLHIATQLCAALDYAHGKGMIHGDLKPNNIIVNEQQNAKITDFPLPELLPDAVGKSVTGTPPYMAPERQMGTEADARADIYSLGVVLWECLTNYETSRITTVNSHIRQVVLRCLEPNADARWPNIKELQSQLERTETVEDRQGAILLGELVIEGPLNNLRVQLTNLHQELFIGREPKRCDIVLNDMACSRLHRCCLCLIVLLSNCSKTHFAANQHTITPDHDSTRKSLGAQKMMLNAENLIPNHRTNLRGPANPQNVKVLFLVVLGHWRVFSAFILLSFLGCRFGVRGLESTKENQERSAEIQRRLKRADVPLVTAEIAASTLSIAKSISEFADEIPSSDLQTAVLLAHASTLSALSNVKTNLARIHDEQYLNLARSKLDELQQQIERDKSGAFSNTSLSA